MTTFALPGRFRIAAVILVVLLVLAGLIGQAGDVGSIAAGAVPACAGVMLASLQLRLRFAVDGDVLAVRGWRTQRIRLPDAAWFVMLRPGPGRPTGTGTRLNLSATRTRQLIDEVRNAGTSQAVSLVAVAPDGAMVGLPVAALRDQAFGAALDAALAAYPGPERAYPSAVRRTTDAPTLWGWRRRTLLFAPGYAGRVMVVVGVFFAAVVAGVGLVSVRRGHGMGPAPFLSLLMLAFAAFGALLAWRDSRRARREGDWPWSRRAPRLDHYPLEGQFLP